MSQWSQIISASVVPVVIISACGLLCLAFYNRLASIVSRLRNFQRERLDQHQLYARCVAEGRVDRLVLIRHQRMLEMLEQQTTRVIRRARLIRRTLLCLLGTIACLTVCSLALGLGVRWPNAAYVAVPVYFAGAGLLLAGVLFAFLEMVHALEPVELESDFVSRLSQEFAEPVENGTFTGAKRQKTSSG